MRGTGIHAYDLIIYLWEPVENRNKKETKLASSSEL